MSEPRARPTLGRGLAALLGGDAAEAAPGARPSDQLHRVPVDRLRPNPEQPRERFDDAALHELAASVKVHGVLEPIVARRDPAGGYVIIAGERRWRASRLAGLADVPVLVLGRDLTGVEQLELALIENLQREDLDPIEAATGYQRLVQQYGLSQEQVAQAVGKDRATVANALRLLKLPEAGLKALRERRITAGHARALLALENPEQFRVALATVITRELSVRATEQLVKNLKKGATEKPRSPSRPAVRLGDSLTRSLGTRVQVVERNDGSGRIVIDYRDGGDLDRLATLLRGD